MSKKNNPKLDFGKYGKEEDAPKISFVASDVVFSFKYICTGQHSTAQCPYHQLKSFNDKLRMLSSLSWSKIRSSPRETLGFEMVPITSLKRSLPDQVSERESVMVFRFGGGSGSKTSGRVAGYQDGNTFYVLFVDSNLSLYDH